MFSLVIILVWKSFSFSSFLIKSTYIELGICNLHIVVNPSSKFECVPNLFFYLLPPIVVGRLSHIHLELLMPDQGNPISIRKGILHWVNDQVWCIYLGKPQIKPLRVLKVFLWDDWIANCVPSADYYLNFKFKLL